MVKSLLPMDRRVPEMSRGHGKRVVLLLKVGDLLLGELDGIVADDDAAQRLLFVHDREQRLCELGWVARGVRFWDFAREADEDRS